MSTIELKEKLNHYINQHASSELLLAIEQLIAHHESGQQITPMTVEELKNRVAEARADRLAGRTYTTDQVRAYFLNKQS